MRALFALEPEMDSRSDKSGMVCRGGTNVVDLDPEPEPEPEPEPDC